MPPPVMKMLATLILLAAVQPAIEPQRRADARAAYDARRAGHILPLKEIERRVVPTMKGAQYLGVDFDSDDAVYTLKFLRDGAVIWVEVDGRSGQVIGRSR